MRRILVERARRKRSRKRGGVIEHAAVEELADSAPNDTLDLSALDKALTDFEHLPTLVASSEVASRP